MKEEWKKIKGAVLNEKYEISNTGKVRNSETGKILKSRPDKEGYLIITISVDKVRRTVKIHRLVAEAFIPNPENKPQVNHKDGKHDNNCVSNLEWCTSSENHLHAYRTLGRKAHRSESSGRAKRKVMCVETGIIYTSATEAAKSVNGKQGALSTVCRGERNIYKGLHWKYVG